MVPKNLWVILLSLIVLCERVSAGEKRTEIMVDFRVNVTYIDPSFSDNALRLQEIVSYLEALSQDSSLTITSVAFCGAASPEGSYEWNRHLAAARLASLEAAVRGQVAIPDSITTRDDSYIPWGYLRSQVAESDLDYRDAVIEIIDMEPCLVLDSDNGKYVDSRIPALKMLDDRRVWKDLQQRYFSKMRNASAVIITYRDDKRKTAPLPAIPASAEVKSYLPPPPALIIQPSPAPRMKAPFYMAVYTNTLYDLLATPNAGVAVYLGRNFSVAASWMHAWWSYDRRHQYWRIYGAELNVRHWFGAAADAKPLTGHHIGLYAQALTFDFEFGGTAYMGGEPGGTILDRAHIGGGLEYGYSMPVGRRFNIDISVGLGYIGGRVYELVPDGGRYLWTKTKHIDWFGPTKLEVSAVWLIGHGNVNQPRKGGAR